MADQSFYGFLPLNKQDWIAKALKDTQLDNFDELVSYNTIVDISIPPVLLSEDVEKWDWLRAYDIGKREDEGKREWDNISWVDLDHDDLSTFQSVLSFGIEGVVMEWSGDGDLEELLSDIHPENISIWLKPKKDPAMVLEAFLKWFHAKGLPLSDLKGGFLWDSLLLSFEEKVDQFKLKEETIKVYHMTKEFPFFRGLCLDFSIYHNAGGNTTQELSFGLSALIELMDFMTEKGNAPRDIFSNLFLLTAVGGDYFMNISKLKVLRVMVSQLARLYGFDWSSDAIYFFTTSSVWTKDIMEPNNNMVRNTAEALMAIQGGCNALLILPHDSGSAKVFERRISSNVSNLIKYESHFDKVNDLTAGAYFSLFLMGTIYDKVEEILKEIESKGGWASLVARGAIQSQVKEVRSQRISRMISGEDSVVGLNKYVQGEIFESGFDFEETTQQLKAVSRSLIFYNSKKKGK
ncbi:methylmalonyl-CoA mutase family protein [Echinicola sp. 20G]|uniref:methylmalonyl-CoA mutase family protein n=1 Tax=Echinicola sp. 20G TaxID=2781961 RepID=UPI0019102B31|nr:methylmalonyl-CoA mutase family protein [Echinicola sp. 20G]